MKKFFKVLTASTILLLISYSFVSAEEQGKGQKKMREKHEAMMQPAGQPVKAAIGIRMRMRRIEMEAIKNDPELQELQKQIEALRKQLNEKLQTKLADNEEYQKLKEQLEKMKQQAKERWQERRKKNKEKGKNVEEEEK